MTQIKLYVSAKYKTSLSWTFNYSFFQRSMNHVRVEVVIFFLIWPYDYSHSLDENECLGNNYSCPNNSICVNTVGSYTCLCKSGFTRSGQQCNDVNECIGNNTCHNNSTCTNELGGYNCSCQDGYKDESPSGQTGRICTGNDARVISEMCRKCQRCVENVVIPICKQMSVSKKDSINILCTSVFDWT